MRIETTLFFINFWIHQAFFISEEMRAKPTKAIKWRSRFIHRNQMILQKSDFHFNFITAESQTDRNDVRN